MESHGPAQRQPDHLAVSFFDLPADLKSAIHSGIHYVLAMKPCLPLALLALLLSCTFAAAEPSTLHVYILTGQSNSLGSVKGSPASAELLEQYRSSVLMWNGNMTQSTGVCFEKNPSWQTVAPQLPIYNGNRCMGPEYGFAYMMERKGWQTSGGDDIALVKASLDGGGNHYWVRGTAAYNSILETVKNAMNAVDGSKYAQIDLSGLMYLQGESDTAAEVLVAQERYLAFFDNLKSDLTAAGIDTSALTQSVLGECATWNGNETTAVKDGATVSSASEQKALADAREDTGWVHTRDLTKITSGDEYAVHYDGKSQITIGARYAYAMAMQQGIDVGSVRGDDDSVPLNEAGAWWMGALPGVNDIAVWDVSSANVEDQLTGNLALSGIRVEDTFRDGVVIANAASGTRAVLSLGGGGVESQARNLSLRVDVATTAEQTWKVGGGHAFSIGEASSPAALKGNHAVSLERQGTGTAVFALHASTADARTWTMGDGVSLQLSPEAGVWAGHSFRVADGASAAIGLSGGSALDVSSLALGSGAALDFGGNAALTLSASSLDLAGEATFQMNLSTATSYDRFILGDGGLTLGDGAKIHFVFDYGEALSVTRNYTIFENWQENVAFDFNAQTVRGRAAQLQVVGGNLVLSFSGNGAYAVDWVAPPAGSAPLSITAAGVFDATAQSGITDGVVSSLTRGMTATGDVYFFACASNHTGDVYAELADTSTKWISTFGSTSSSSYRTMTGNAHLKVTGENTLSYANIYGVVNGTLHGDAYIELDAAGATYSQYSGAHNAVIDGSLTLVVRSGTFTGTLNGGFVTNNASQSIGRGVFVQIDNGSFQTVYMGNGVNSRSGIRGGTHLTIYGGTFAGHVYGGGQAGTIEGGAEVVIDGGTFNGFVSAGSNGAGTTGEAPSIVGDACLDIAGGTFNNYVIAAGFAGTVDGNVLLTISGGNFSALNTAKGIYAGVGSTSGTVTGNTVVTLKNIDDTNEFAAYTGILSGGNQAAGTLSGTKSLILDGYTASVLGHKLRDFDSVTLKNGSSTSIASTIGLGGASSLSIEAGSRLALQADAAWDLAGVSVAVDGEIVAKGADVSFGTVRGSGVVTVQENRASFTSLSDFAGTVRVASGASAAVEASGAGAAYDLQSGASLTVAASNGNMGKLNGAGIVSLSGDGGTVNSAFAFERWTGTVRLSGMQAGKSGNNVVIDFNKFGCAGSTIELTGFGVGGNLSYIAQGGTYAANMRLEADEAGRGLALNAGSSSATYTFTGAWSGEGDFSFAPATANVTCTFAFAGDMTRFAGDYTVGCGATLAFGNGDIGAPGSVSGTGTINGTGNARAHVSYNFANSVEAANVLAGNLDVTKKGIGDLTLTGANNYTGGTTVESGQLRLSGAGSFGAGALQVNDAAGAEIATEKLSVQARGGNARVEGMKTALAASSTTIEGTAQSRVGISHATLTLGQSGARAGEAYALREANLTHSIVVLRQATSLTLENVSFDGQSGLEHAQAGASSVTMRGTENTLTIGALAQTDLESPWLENGGKTYAGLTTSQLQGVTLEAGALLTIDVTNELLCSEALRNQGWLAVKLDGFVGTEDGIVLSDHLAQGFLPETPSIVRVDLDTLPGSTLVYVQFDPALLPEPSAAALGLIGLGAALLRRRRKTEEAL